ncbi:MAG: orotate phosphoribosyltransferase [Bacilli bacterium]|nr:orotate phosphoribosyltransferase [Bacilli bacterium]
MEQTIAKMLLQIGAVIIRPLEPFTWTSGLKSPMYCDNRLTISYPQVRRAIARGFVELIEREFGAVDVVAGTSTAGIPHAAYVSELLNVPMAYIRDKPKGHGKLNRIEGRIHSSHRVVVIEDAFSTGGSSIAAAKAVVEDTGAQVAGVAAIYSYQFPRCEQNFRDAGFNAYSLTGYAALMKAAVEMGIIQEADANFLAKWRENPEGFQWMEQQ